MRLLLLFYPCTFCSFLYDGILNMQCPHDGPCPLEKTGKYCHFVQRLERTSSQRAYKVCWLFNSYINLLFIFMH